MLIFKCCRMCVNWTGENGTSSSRGKWARRQLHTLQYTITYLQKNGQKSWQIGNISPVFQMLTLFPIQSYHHCGLNCSHDSCVVPQKSLRFCRFKMLHYDSIYPNTYISNTQNLFIYLFRWDFLFQIYHEFGFQIASLHPLSLPLSPFPIPSPLLCCSIRVSVSISLIHFLRSLCCNHLPIKCYAPPKIKIKS